MHWLQKLRLLWIDGGKAFGTVTDSACGYSTAYMGSGFLFSFLVRSFIVLELWVSSFSAQKMYNCRLENCLVMGAGSMSLPRQFRGWMTLSYLDSCTWYFLRSSQALLVWLSRVCLQTNPRQLTWRYFSHVRSWSPWQGDTCSNAFPESDGDTTTYIDPP